MKRKILTLAIAAIIPMTMHTVASAQVGGDVDTNVRAGAILQSNVGIANRNEASLGGVSGRVGGDVKTNVRVGALLQSNVGIANRNEANIGSTNRHIVLRLDIEYSDLLAVKGKNSTVQLHKRLPSFTRLRVSILFLNSFKPIKKLHFVRK